MLKLFLRERIDRRRQISHRGLHIHCCLSSFDRLSSIPSPDPSPDCNTDHESFVRVISRCCTLLFVSPESAAKSIHVYGCIYRQNLHRFQLQCPLSVSVNCIGKTARALSARLQVSPSGRSIDQSVRQRLEQLSLRESIDQVIT